MTEAVPEDAFLACARAGLCHVKGMIAFLRGTVAESYPQRLILDVHGVGYEVIVPLSTFDRLNPLPGRELTLKTYLHVRENMQVLYGFATDAERDIFLLLIERVSGIGPATAIAILGSLSVEQFKQAVVGGDVSGIARAKGVADPTRLRIINVLNEESLSVAELQEILGMGQSRISTQLAQLRQEGVVEDARSGKNVFYTLSLAGDLHNVALKACEELPEAETDKKALQVILDKRKNRTQAYFDEVVCRLGKNYAPGRSWKALAGALLRILNYDVVADLGAGEGFVSQLISPSAKQVIAVDNSPSMVELGQELARKHGLDNLEYRLGDIEAPPIKPGTVDLALLSQALHHAQKPSRALEAAWDILKSGGCLVVLDLLQHGQEEARELYADRWLGFTPAALESMLKEAGFRNIHTDIVDREPDPPHFQTLMAAAWKP